MSEWHPIDTAPHDGTSVIVFDGFGVYEAAYEADISLEDFLLICDEGEGEKEWKEYLTENRGRGWITHESLSGDLVLLCPTKWQPMPKP